MSQPLDGSPLEVLTLSLDEQHFALEATHVREILDVTPVTEVPTAQPFVAHLINVRGKVVPLADLRQRFGMPPRPTTLDTRFVVIEIEVGGDMTTVALIADKVHEVAEMTAGSLAETPRIGMYWRPEFIRCIAKRDDRFVVVLDIAAVLASALSPGLDSAGDGTDRHAA